MSGQHPHQARKRFGQNFLHDPGVIQRILDAVNPQADQHLVEIGPGQGAITAGLLEMAGALDLIELDRDLITPLAQRFGGRVIAGRPAAERCDRSRQPDAQPDAQSEAKPDAMPNPEPDASGIAPEPSRLRIYNADALSFDLCALLRSGPSGLQSTASLLATSTLTDQMPMDSIAGANVERPYPPTEHRLRLIGNLPYNISTPLLFRFLDQADCIEDMHLMLQKEVVERMTAEPGTKVYGRLSVMVQTFCSAQRLFLVSAGAFHPAPKVSSAVTRLRPHRPLPCPLAAPLWHARIVAAAFAQRRKTLRNSLSGLVTPEQMIAQGIDPQARAETLSVANFAALANATSACIETKIP